MRNIVAGLIGIACALLYAAPPTGAAMMGGDVKKELQTAIFHSSELAQRGNAVAAAKLHLQHVINCLEGPNGADFQTSAGYPCQGMGNGIIPDLKAQVAAKVPGADEAMKQAMLAWTLAKQGIAKNDVNEVQPWAKVVSDYLKAALQALGS
ncbi:MAG TPA: hypothetical protein VKV57_10475 [bacterium]|nr:hypothetical protein [bacterium]